MMDRAQAVGKFEQYLKAHNLKYSKGVDNGAGLITMAFPAPECPGQWIEACAWFYGDGMEARVYYSQSGADFCRESEHRDGLFRLLNFINARVFLSAADGFNGKIYAPHMLYTPRLYMTEDDCFDITMTTMIPYDFYELAPLETADYVTIFCVELLKDLSLPIFFLLGGKWTAEESVAHIKCDVLEKA